jgi:universal stress protein A
VRALVKTGSASQSITDTANSDRADLIIMATHGRTGLAHMFLGSVTEKVVRTAACPVLTVRHPQDKAHEAAKRRRRAAVT